MAFPNRESNCFLSVRAVSSLYSYNNSPVIVFTTSSFHLKEKVHDVCTAFPWWFSFSYEIHKGTSDKVQPQKCLLKSNEQFIIRENIKGHKLYLLLEEIRTCLSSCRKLNFYKYVCTYRKNPHQFYLRIPQCMHLPLWSCYY